MILYINHTFHSPFLLMSSLGRLSCLLVISKLYICCIFFRNYLLFFLFVLQIFYSPLFIFVDFSSDSSQNVPLTVSNELLNFSCYFLTPEFLLFTIFYFQSFIYFSIILYYINMPMMGTLQKLELSSGGRDPCSTGFPR